MCMRTNIDIDDDLISQAMKILKLKTKKDVVNQALLEVIRRDSQSNIAKMRGKITFWDGYYEDKQ